MPYTKRREKLHKQFGEACQICGYNKSSRALHFHHIDSSEKYSDKWGRESSKGKATELEIEAHPERFMLVCANCHAELHDKEAKENHNFETCQECGKVFRSDKHRLSIGRGKFCSRECHIIQRDKYAMSFASVEKRFWKHVIVQDGCWGWKASFNPIHGAPTLQVKQANGKYTMRLCTRISYQIHFGELPQNAYVVRTCGNIECLNPAHLKLKS